MTISLQDLAAGARFLRALLPPLLRRPIDSEEARGVLARRLAGPADNFLAIIRDLIYGSARPLSGPRGPR